MVNATATAMSRKDFIHAISKKTGFTLGNSETALEAILETVKEAIINNNTVNLINFGKFEPVTKGACTRVNPLTGKMIDIPEKNGIKFKPSINLKSELNG